MTTAATDPFDYAEAVADAIELIADFGATAAIRRSSVTGGNAWDPSSGTTTTVDHACTAAVVDYANKDVNGTLIRQTDRRVLVSVDGLDIEPANTDLFITGGIALQIINVKPLNPAGTVVMYDMQCRG